MKFYVTSKSFSSLSGDVLVVFAVEGEKEAVFTKELTGIDGATKGLCKTLLHEEGFTGKKGAIVVVQTGHLLPFKKVFILGLGKKENISMETWQYVCACIARHMKSLHLSSLVFPLPVFSSVRVAYGAVVGLGLGSYSFLVHKNKKMQQEEQEIQKVTFVAEKQRMAEVGQEIIEGVVAVDAVSMSRDLVNEPPSVTTPTYLSRMAKTIAKKSKIVSCTVLGKDKLKKLGMNGILAVSQGSHEEPKFVKLVYRGGGAKTITLVGKGITYDSGGLSLKPQSGLETMKCDMAGAAAILGVFQGLLARKPKITVVGLMALCENMPGGGAIKPGDIVRVLNGKTVEIVNTDAEGRIILADALSYAEKYIQSDIVIDLATLTGACVVALGEDVAGVFSDDEKLSADLIQEAQRVGENLWRLPMVSSYEEHLKSEVADVRNVSKTRYGGAINGALFLKAFAPKEVPWAHIDIAGPAFAEKDMTISPYGATGFGVQTVLSFIEGQVGKR